MSERTLESAQAVNTPNQGDQVSAAILDSLRLSRGVAQQYFDRHAALSEQANEALVNGLDHDALGFNTATGALDTAAKWRTISEEKALELWCQMQHEDPNSRITDPEALAALFATLQPNTPVIAPLSVYRRPGGIAGVIDGAPGLRFSAPKSTGYGAPLAAVANVVLPVRTSKEYVFIPTVELESLTAMAIGLEAVQALAARVRDTPLANRRAIQEAQLAILHELGVPGVDIGKG